MKRLVALAILFCLTFLNVPREFVHDCTSHHVTQLAKNTHKKSHHSTFQIDQDECQFCSFDLGYYSKTAYNWYPQNTLKAIPYVSTGIELVTNDPIKLNQLRGPPTSA